MSSMYKSEYERQKAHEEHMERLARFTARRVAAGKKEEATKGFLCGKFGWSEDDAEQIIRRVEEIIASGLE